MWIEWDGLLNKNNEFVFIGVRLKEVSMEYGWDINRCVIDKEYQNRVLTLIKNEVKHSSGYQILECSFAGVWNDCMWIRTKVEKNYDWSYVIWAHDNLET